MVMANPCLRQPFCFKTLLRSERPCAPSWSTLIHLGAVESETARGRNGLCRGGGLGKSGVLVFTVWRIRSVGGS